MISGISIWSLLLILGIVILLFGTKKLRSLGSDLGEAVRGFRRSVSDEGGSNNGGQTKEKADQPDQPEQANTDQKPNTD